MTLQLTYPGLYVQELPSGSHTISGVSTSTTGFVGYLRRGPMNQPVQCFNFGDFQRAFGGLDASSPTSFQVYQFFLNGGSEAWISRLCAASAPPVLPQIQLVGQLAPSSSGGGGSKTPAAPTGSTVLNVTAANPGTWGEGIFLTVDYMTSALDTFNLTASLYSIASTSPSSNSYALSGTQPLSTVTLNPGPTPGSPVPNFIGEVLAEQATPGTSLIAATLPTGNSATAIPVASGTMLIFNPPVIPPPPAAPPPPVMVQLTVTVVAPAIGTAKPVTSSAQCPGNVPVSAIGDLVGAIQQAMSNAAGALGMPGLASAVVRSCTSPFAPATAGAQPAPLIQVWVPDPAYAGYLIGISGSPSTTFSTMSTNYQAQPLVVPAPSGAGGSTTTPTPPDGLPPGGFDVAGNPTNRTGIYALDNMQIVNLIALPDLPGMTVSDYQTSATSLLNYSQARRAFAIVDLPATVDSPTEAVTWAQQTPASLGAGIINAAGYFPGITVQSPYSTTPMPLGPSGTMAGLYAATDVSRGVWKAPAGITVATAGVEALQYVMSDQENGQINPLGINALRNFPIYSNVAWGARTFAAPNVADQDWKYIPVRRLALYIEQSLVQGLQWVVFEPNDASLWAQIRLSVNAFLQPLFQQGAFAGMTPADAYLCMCDESTTTPTDQANGVVNILVKFAPVRPAEFVVITIQQMAGQTSS